MHSLKNLSLKIIYGAPGAGKTTLADLLYNELSNLAHFGVDHIKRFISGFRTTPSHNDVSIRVVNAMTAEYLKNGISVIVEQGLTRKEIESLREIAKANGALFLVYRLEAENDILSERIVERTNRLGKPTIPQEAINEAISVLKKNDYPSTRVLDSGKMNTREMADVILSDLMK